QEVEALHAAGARLFVEVGPQSVLTGLVARILTARPHLAVAADQKGRPGLVQLQHLLGQLLVHGVAVRLDRLFEARSPRTLDLARLDKETGKPKLTPSTWIVNSVRNRPVNAPEPKLLGQAWEQNGAAPKPVTAAKPSPAPSSAPMSTPASTVSERPAAPPASPPPVPAAPPVAVAPAVNSNGYHPPVTAALPADESAQVMLRFQDLMARFLETQKAVMVSYLQGGSPGA